MGLTEQEWKARLSPERVLQFCVKRVQKSLLAGHLCLQRQRIYSWQCCGEALFTDDMKFDSNCGWPSFDKEIAGGKIIRTEDYTHGMKRVEITCAVVVDTWGIYLTNGWSN